MSTDRDYASQRSQQGGNNVRSTADNPVGSQQLVNTYRSDDKQNQSSVSQTSQRNYSLPPQSDENDQSSRGHSGTKRRLASSADDDQKSWTVIDHKDVPTAQSERHRGSSSSDHSSNSDVQYRKPSKSGASNKPAENASTTNENVPKSSDDSSQGPKNQSALIDKVDPTSTTKESKRQSTVSELQNDVPLTSNGNSFSLHSLPTGTTTPLRSNPNSKPNTPDASKSVAGRSNQVDPKKSGRSIISSAVSAALSDPDDETKDGEGSESAPNPSASPSPASDKNKQKYQGGDLNGQSRTNSESSDVPKYYRTNSSTSSKADKEQSRSPTNTETNGSEREKIDRDRKSSQSGTSQRSPSDSSISPKEEPSDVPNYYRTNSSTSSKANKEQSQSSTTNEIEMPDCDKSNRDRNSSQFNTLQRSPSDSSISPKEELSDVPNYYRTNSSTSSKADNEQNQSSTAIETEASKYESRDRNRKSSQFHTPQQSPSLSPVSPKDEYQQYQTTSSNYPPKDTEEHYLAYIPYLSANDLKTDEIQTRIRRYLKDKLQLHVMDVKCNSRLDFGVVYLETKKGRDYLVNTIQKIPIRSESDQSISFVAQLKFVSYVAVDTKDKKDAPRVSEIERAWGKFYPSYDLYKCDRLCDEFPQIFQIVIDQVEKLIDADPRREFSVRDSIATVYFRADCGFFEALPRDTSSKDLRNAISKQLSSTNLSRTISFIAIDTTENQAVVIISDEVQGWKSLDSIILNGQALVKKDQFTYYLRLRSVPHTISAKTIEEHRIFDGTVLRCIVKGSDVIVELSEKSVYENCLQQRILRIDGHKIDIEANVTSRQQEYDKIDARNWYETEMHHGGSSVVDFINDPQHRIFQMKWDSQAFLEQFKKCSSLDSSGAYGENDNHSSRSDQHRHLIRMTVMLNTIGNIQRGRYTVNGEEIKLKSDTLTTIVYKHQSVLEKQKRLSSSRDINYPYKSTRVRVKNTDCLIAYKEMVDRGYHPLLLNMANAHSPGGGYRRGDGAQEENVFRRSNYYRSLDMELDQGQPTSRFRCSSSSDVIKLTGDEKMYSIDDFGAIYTSGLTVFRQPEDTGYEFMDEPLRDVCAIAVAAYRKPKLEGKNLSLKYSIGTRKKVETIFAVAKHHNHDCLILSAFGCGAFRNPPEDVAHIFKSVIEQYAGFFKYIYFAIVDDHNTGQDLNPHGNYQPFQRILDGLEIKPNSHVKVDMMIGPWRILSESKSGEITLSDAQICDLVPCRYGTTCRDIDRQSHCREYAHPPACPLPDGSKGCDDKNHMLWFRHGKRRSGTNPLCPWTPFHCQQHILLSESKEPHKLPMEVQNHCREFRHICQFGRQCQRKAGSHWETDVHIARELCRDGDKCSKTDQEIHLTSFSHPRITDIRRLCDYAVQECPDSKQPDHLAKYRHRNGRQSHGIIPYRGINRDINFIQNQRDIMTTIGDRGERLNAKDKPSIPHPVLKCIQGLSPIYQCSKDVLEFILVHGHVISNDRIEQLTNPTGLLQVIKESKDIQPILARHNDQTTENHIHEFIRAVVMNVQNRRDNRASSATTNDYTAGYSPSAVSKENFDDTIRKEERYLRNAIGGEEIDIIHKCTLKITEASLKLSTSFCSTRQSNKPYISTILGPRLSQNDEDIVLVFKRDVMLHPDARMSLQSNRRSKQVSQMPLHCSVYGYKEAAVAALMSTDDTNKKLTDIDRPTIMRHLSSAKPNQLFEGQLPELIPLDYIEEIYIPQHLFSSIPSAVQTKAKEMFGNSLHVVPHEANRHQDYVNEKLVAKLDNYVQQSHKQLFGTTITLPASHLTEYVPLPFTITQAYDQYRQNYKRSPLSDDIYIYWQAMQGDMMVVLSNEPIDPAKNSKYIQSLICYVAETPSITRGDYRESDSYIHFGHPSQHGTIVAKRSFQAYSNEFYRGCNLDQYLTYCLKVERATRQVSLSHAGPNSIYNNQIISHRFEKSDVNLNDLKYVQIAADSHQVSVRNLMVCFHPLPDLHPICERNFRSSSNASRSVSPPPSPAPKESASSSIVSVVTNAVSNLFGYGAEPKKLPPCRDSINCLRQMSHDHSEKYSHPCRFSELCRSRDKEPNLTHETHRVTRCKYDKTCRQLNDPFHRAQYRHTELPDFLIPCRHQTACKDRSDEHRKKYSHGEKIDVLFSAAASDKPPAHRSATPSSENYSKEQNKLSSPASYDQHGSKHRDQENRPRSSYDPNHGRTPARLSSADRRGKDVADHLSPRPSSSSSHHRPLASSYDKKPSTILISLTARQIRHRMNSLASILYSSTSANTKKRKNLSLQPTNIEPMSSKPSRCQVGMLFRSSTPKTPLTTRAKTKMAVHPTSLSPASSSMSLSINSPQSPRCSTPLFSKQRRTRPFITCELCRQRAFQSINEHENKSKVSQVKKTHEKQQQHHHHHSTTLHYHQYQYPTNNISRSIRRRRVRRRSSMEQLLVWIL